MKTAVVFKWTRDPQDARVSADGSISWPNVKFSPTDDDPAAMQVAKAISSEEDIVGITIGDGKPEWAAARGASETVIIEDAFGGADGMDAARAIGAAVLKRGDIDVVAVGDSEWDRGMVGALAGVLGWTAYAGVVSASASDDGVLLSIKQAKGNMVVLAHPPILVAAQALSQESNIPGMKQILAGRKKPVEKISMGDLGDFPSRAASCGTHLPENDSAVMFDGSDDSAITSLIEALRGEGVL